MSHGIPRGDAVRVAARIAASSFGGPAGQIAVMHRVVVDERGWIGDQRFTHALGYCMVLPGPEAHQLVTYLGWLLYGVPGGLVAGGLLILPGFLSILGLSLAYVYLRDLGPVAGVLFGVKAAILSVVVEAVLRLGKRVLGSHAARAVAAASFVSIFALGVPFPLVIAAAALLGAAARGTGAFAAGGAASRGQRVGSLDAWLDRQPPAPLWRSVAVFVGGLGVWLGPIVGVAGALGPDHLLTQLGVFFAQAAVVTFGGAYAVLAWVAQAAVEQRGWVTAGEMLDGLGLAEATPGPLIQVVQFVGFLAGWKQPGPWGPLGTALAASLLTTWVTFVPSFLWIFAGAPFVERLRSNRAWASALGAVTASVVGAVLNLAVWLGLHVFFRDVSDVVWGPLSVPVPALGSVDAPSVGIGVLAAWLLLRRHQSMLVVLAVGGALGLVVGWAPSLWS